MNPFRKRLLLTLLLLCGLTAASAQHHFDAQAFEAEKQTYIVQQAHLTPEETRRFVPLYKEMVAKKRKILGQLRQLRKQSADNDRAARALIERRDNKVAARMRTTSAASTAGGGQRLSLNRPVVRFAVGAETGIAGVAGIAEDARTEDCSKEAWPA